MKTPPTALGQRYGRLVVTVPPVPMRNSRTTCRCDCGSDVVVPTRNLRVGKTRSCGCIQREKAADQARAMGAGNVTHGRTDTPEFNAWHNMKLRCYDPGQPSYPNYGGRGITVCDHWRDSFENFLADMGEKPTPQHTLGRIDNDGHYCPENCRWETQTQQQRNRRDTVFYEMDGERLCLKEWAERYNQPYTRVWMRMQKGWDLRAALTKPAIPRSERIKGVPR